MGFYEMLALFIAGVIGYQIAKNVYNDPYRDGKIEDLQNQRWEKHRQNEELELSYGKARNHIDVLSKKLACYEGLNRLSIPKSKCDELLSMSLASLTDKELRTRLVEIKDEKKICTCMGVKAEWFGPRGPITCRTCHPC